MDCNEFAFQHIIRFSFCLVGGRQQQGCQIFLGTTYQNGKNVLNNHKIFKTATKIDQMVIK
jgi:hypothetical protein